MKRLSFYLFAWVSLTMQAQDLIHISGQVLNEDAMPISYATIVILDASQKVLSGTLADYDGFYDLTFNASLPVVFCQGYSWGYKDTTIPLTKEPKQVIDIILNTIDCSQAFEIKNNLLEPTRFSGSNQYDLTLLDTLIPRGETVHFAYIVAPSFEPEYGLIYNRQKNNFVYSEVIGPNSIAYSINSKMSYMIKRWEFRIDSTIQDSIYVLMRTAIATASIPKEDPECEIVGNDGTIYHFIANYYQAECWSPSGGNNAELVRIMDAVCQAVKSQNPVLLQPLLPVINRLTSAYDEHACR